VRVKIFGFAAKVAVYFGGLIVPLVLWVIYLNMTHWALYKESRPLMAVLFFAAALLAFIPTLFLRPNANSLHPLYRDHLGKAFIFKPPSSPFEKKDLDPWRHFLAISRANMDRII